MATATRQGAVSVRFGSGVPGRKLLTAVSARLRGPWLDRELAAGVEPWRSPAHRVRSLQITSPRARRSLAASLESQLKRAQTPSLAVLYSAVVPQDPRTVLGAELQLALIAARLRADAPVSPRGVAALREVISDGSGPLYGAANADALGQALKRISAYLDVPD